MQCFHLVSLPIRTLASVPRLAIEKMSCVQQPVFVELVKQNMVQSRTSVVIYSQVYEKLKGTNCLDIRRRSNVSRYDNDFFLARPFFCSLRSVCKKQVTTPINSQPVLPLAASANFLSSIVNVFCFFPRYQVANVVKMPQFIVV